MFLPENIRKVLTDENCITDEIGMSEASMQTDGEWVEKLMEHRCIGLPVRPEAFP